MNLLLALFSMIYFIIRINCQSAPDVAAEIQLASQCQNLTCLNRGSFFSIQHGRECGCVCQYGFEGAKCEINRLPTLKLSVRSFSMECGSYTCFNGGKYLEILDMNECGCICAHGYNGQHCESDMVSDPKTPQFASNYSATNLCADFRCSNGGSYYSLRSGKECGCICPPGFQGKHCNITSGAVSAEVQKTDNLISDCVNYMCQNEGQFYSFQHGRECGCICTENYDGLHCTSSVNQNLGPGWEMFYQLLDKWSEFTGRKIE